MGLWVYEIHSGCSTTRRIIRSVWILKTLAFKWLKILFLIKNYFINPKMEGLHHRGDLHHSYKNPTINIYRMMQVTP